MKANDLLHLALVLYVLAGYVVVYRYAERSLKNVEPPQHNTEHARQAEH